jgi:hypothetical protein
MGRSSAGPPCAGASAAASRVAPGTPTTAPVGAGGSGRQAAPGPSAAGGAVDAGGVAPRARGARPGSRSPWPPPSRSRAAPARGCGAAPGRRTTTPHATSADEGRQARRHRSPSSSGSCWSPYRSTSGTPRVTANATAPLRGVWRTDGRYRNQHPNPQLTRHVTVSAPYGRRAR